MCEAGYETEIRCELPLILQGYLESMYGAEYHIYLPTYANNGMYLTNKRKVSNHDNKRKVSNHEPLLL